MKVKSHFYMGAINKETGEYIFPRDATKQDKYKCPSCYTDVTWKNGKINIPHFAHKSNCNCDHFTSPSESEIHKCGKRLIKQFIDTRQILKINCECKYCKGYHDYITYTDDTKCYEEYSFKHNGSTKMADVALVDDDELVYIFEIYKTHKTDEQDRPSDKWCEIDAEKLIIETMERSNINSNGEIEIDCMRDFICEDCILQAEKTEELRIKWLLKWEEKEAQRRLEEQKELEQKQKEEAIKEEKQKIYWQKRLQEQRRLQRLQKQQQLEEQQRLQDEEQKRLRDEEAEKWRIQKEFQEY